MKLNIYVISHPLIKAFNQINIENNTNHLRKLKLTKIKNESKIMLFLIYEVMRKLIIITNIYINKKDRIKCLSMMDYEQKNYILTNIIKNFSILTEVSDTFPQTDITHIHIDDGLKCRLDNIKNINEKTKIIIIEKNLAEDYIIQLIQYIKNNLNIKEQSITIASITCTNQILEKISKYYDEINLYTTSIIYN